MKKITTLLALICVLNFNLKAQDEENCVHQGTSLVDVYYGFPNLYGAVFKALVVQSNAINVTTSGFGPVGGKYEYMLTHMFGMGLDFNYSTFTVKYADATTNGNGNPVVYHYSFTTPAFRAMLGFNFHFVRTKSIDAYAAVKTGYYSRSFTFTADDPNYNFTVKSLIPIAFRLETGMRYFFTPNVGVHVNIGIGGGPVLAGGLALKF